AAGLDAQMGGNIGTAILSLEPPSPSRVHVVECSSYQIDLAPTLAPSVGILLNVTPDHLDRHGAIEHYAAVKERLVAGAETAVIGVDDDWCRAIADRLESAGRRVLRISVERTLSEGLYADGSRVIWRRGGSETAFDLSGIGSLRGAHNAQNAAAAIAAVASVGVEPDAIRAGLRSFPGLAHRMDEVGRLGRVLFVNDSKATNADATEKALAAFPGGIHWIVGGVQKEGGIAPLAPYFGRVARAYLIGKSMDDFEATLGASVPVTRSETMQQAVADAVAGASAHADASGDAEPVVLLSPACASFDQYRNFELRGTHFRDLVLALPGIAPLGKV
ncbi:MAG: UDP-N-acetylmuramoyl-L-alanine--D-glutamate ligase, partial [Alsobacter sp.]